MRVRFTIDPEKWAAAEQYAKDTNRTTSELICEALDQIQARYPKRHHATQKEDMALAYRVADILRLQVPAGTSKTNGPGLTGVDWARIRKG